MSGVCGIYIMEAWICLFIILVSNLMEVYIMEALICLFIVLASNLMGFFWVFVFFLILVKSEIVFESVCGFVIDLCLELGVIFF